MLYLNWCENTNLRSDSTNPQQKFRDLNKHKISTVRLYDVFVNVYKYIFIIKPTNVLLKHESNQEDTNTYICCLLFISGSGGDCVRNFLQVFGRAKFFPVC